jgi:HK97 family phage major capsid protein
MPRLADIQTRQAEIRARLTEIEGLEPADDLDEVARASFVNDVDAETDELLEEAEALAAEAAPMVARAQRIERLHGFAQNARATEPGDQRPTGPEVMRKVDPFADLEVIRSKRYDDGDVISRARKAIEVAPRHMTEIARAQVESLLLDLEEDSKQAPLIARHLLLTGSPDYHNEFKEYMRTGYAGELLRANMSLTDANGGYLVPFTLDPTIILTNAGIVDPIRQISTIKTTATDTWSGVTSAGVTAGWTAEAAEATDGAVTTGLLTITPKRADSWIAGSYEVLADSGFFSQLGPLVADAKARLEGAAFATANTAATRPVGIVSAVAAVTASLVSAAATNAFAIADIYAVADALRPRDAANATWLANKKIYNKARQFDTSGSAAFWANLGMGRPNQLLGQDAREASSMAGTIATGAYTLLAGDFSKYYIVDRIGLQMLYNPMVMGRTNSRPTGEAGWMAFWRVGADVADVDAFRLLQNNGTVAFTARG